MEHMPACQRYALWETPARALFGSQNLKYTNSLQISRAAQSLSKAINDKRKARGLQSRPVRACVIGFPNVGKSALINRLLGKRLVDSAPVVGVTRALRWLRVGGDLDLLDAPGRHLVHLCTLDKTGLGCSRGSSRG